MLITVGERQSLSSRNIFDIDDFSALLILINILSYFSSVHSPLEL